MSGRKKRGPARPDGINVTQLAKEAGIHRSFLSEILNGKRKTSFRTAVKLEKLTNGKVMAEDIMTEKDREALREYLKMRGIQICYFEFTLD